MANTVLSFVIGSSPSFNTSSLLGSSSRFTLTVKQTVAIRLSVTKSILLRNTPFSVGLTTWKSNPLMA